MSENRYRLGNYQGCQLRRDVADVYLASPETERQVNRVLGWEKGR